METLVKVSKDRFYSVMSAVERPQYKTGLCAEVTGILKGEWRSGEGEQAGAWAESRWWKITKSGLRTLVNVIRLSVSANWVTYHIRLLPSHWRVGDGALSALVIIFQREGSRVLEKERHSGFQETQTYTAQKERIYNCKGFLFVSVFKWMPLRKGGQGPTVRSLVRTN